MNSWASQGSVGFLFDYISATDARDKFYLPSQKTITNVTINQGSNNKNEVNFYDFVSNKHFFQNDWLEATQYFKNTIILR